jgi:hypothetical protein
MTVAVVTSGADGMNVDSMFPIPAFVTLKAAGRRYSFFRVSKGGADESFVDRTDGEVLLAVHYSQNEAAAEARGHQAGSPQGAAATGAVRHLPRPL